MANKETKVYVTLSENVLNTHLSAGAKIAFAHILSLSTNIGYSYQSTKVMAKLLHVNLRTMQNYLLEIINHSPKLVDYKYKGLKRLYTPQQKYLIDYVQKSDKMKVIITDQILENNRLTPVYKIAHGYLVARGLNLPHTDGYNWDSMVDVARYMGVSVSTAYRYIYKLLEVKMIKRDKTHYLMFITLDRYSKQKRSEAKAVIKDIKTKQDIKDLEVRMHKPLDVPIPKDMDRALDNLFRKIK